MKKDQKIRHLWLFSFAADIVAIVASYYTTILIRFHVPRSGHFFTGVRETLDLRELGSPEGLLQDYYLSAPRRILFLVATICVLYALNDLYPGRRFMRRRAVAWKMVVVNSISLALFYVYFYLQRNTFHPRSIFILVAFFNVLFCVSFRGLVDSILQWWRFRFGVDQCRTLLVGENPEAKVIDELIEVAHPHGIVVCERLKVDSDMPLNRLLEAITDSVKTQSLDMVVLAQKNLSLAETMEVLNLTERLDVSAKVLSDHLDVLVTAAGVSVDLVLGTPLVHFERPHLRRGNDRIMRILSAIVAMVSTVIAIPLMAILALLVKGTSRGSVFFVQDRIGADEKSFRMLKFRTMYEGADASQDDVEAFNELDGTLFKIRKDPRVTLIGRCLRRFSLDELPQLFHVLQGKMRIVGPRPLSKRDYGRNYEEWHYHRHGGVPGLTGLWQVSGRSELDFHSMCILDVYYLRNASLMLDLKIILRTFIVVLFAKGAY